MNRMYEPGGDCTLCGDPCVLELCGVTGGSAEDSKHIVRECHNNRIPPVVQELEYREGEWTVSGEGRLLGYENVTAQATIITPPAQPKLTVGDCVNPISILGRFGAQGPSTLAGGIPLGFIVTQEELRPLLARGPGTLGGPGIRGVTMYRPPTGPHTEGYLEQPRVLVTGGAEDSQVLELGKGQVTQMLCIGTAVGDDKPLIEWVNRDKCFAPANTDNAEYVDVKGNAGVVISVCCGGYCE
eukprot:CAMPEP_0174949664 /NCGR_PEP_ID=MMETSP1355-20121228/92040_1 /TAXON_ID=464990 /ORGANISM="Hemiselmis tepida, Strain CCMP443" /LENGTH=240 /DNA_ID=CAMNT_0016197229 /DNA_START=54 /DNA_END=773 /DNA_ORIENTATION=+